MSFFKKIFDFIKKLLSKLWQILKRIIAIILIMVAIYLFFIGYWWLALILFAAAYMLEPELVGGLVKKIGSAVGSVAGAVVGGVAGGLFAGLTSTPVGWVILGLGGLWLYSKFFGDDEDGESETTEPILISGNTTGSYI